MRKLAAFALLTAALMTIAGCGGSKVYTLQITGTVRNTELGNPELQDVILSAVITGKTKIFTATSGSTGQYSLAVPGLSLNNKIELSAVKTGYDSLKHTFIFSGETSMIQDFYLNKSTGSEKKLEGYATLMNMIPPAGSLSLAKKGIPMKDTTPPPVTQVIVKPKRGISPDVIDKSYSKLGTTVKKISMDFGVYVVGIPKGIALEDFIRKIEAEGWAEYAEPDYPAMPLGIFTPNDPYFPIAQWDMYCVSMPYVWDALGFGLPVTVAVVDTGLDSSHPDLLSQTILPLINTTDEGDTDYQGHGTHVAGIIAATVNNGQYMAGMNNRSARILPIKVLKVSGSSSSDVAEGVAAAVSNGAKIINLSLSVGQLPVTVLANAINDALSKGIIVVAAAGNGGGDYKGRPELEYPASHDGVIAVAAINSNFQKSDFSDYGIGLDFAAPGGNFNPRQYVWGLYPKALWDYTGKTGMAGTSQAAPHVSALYAMLFQNGYTPAQATELIGDTAQFDTRNELEYGKGIINAHAALNSLTMDKAMLWLADAVTGLPVTGILGAVNKDRSYSISVGDIPDGTYLLVGWVDTNAPDGAFTSGDYVGSVYVNVASGTVPVEGVLKLYPYEPEEVKKTRLTPDGTPIPAPPLR